jgi:hypothetical protein
MDAWIYLALSILSGWLLISSLRAFKTSDDWGSVWILFLVMALFFQNLLYTMEYFFGLHEIAEVLGDFNSLLHLYHMPTLVFVALDMLKRINLSWAKSITTTVFSHIYVFCITMIGILMEYYGGSVNFFSNDSDVSQVIFIVAFFIFIPLVISAIALWHHEKWPFLLIALMFTMLGWILSKQYGQPILILSQFLLMWSLILTERRLNQEDYSSNKEDLAK